MSTINSIPFRSTIFYRTDGTVAPIGTVFTISTNGLLNFSNNLSLNTLTASSITGNITTLSSITASTILTTGNNIALGQSVAFPNRYLELGTDVVDSVYLDFHSKDSTLSDYSTRIQSLGGTTTGTGALNMYASTMGLMTNVGIGKTNPTQLLDITNAASLTPAIRLQNTYSAGYVSMGSIVGVNSYIGLQATNTTTSDLGTPVLVVANNGTVGIGTNNPGYPLDVVGESRFGYATGNDFLINLGRAGVGGGYRSAYIYGSSNNIEINNQQVGAFILATNNAERIRITSTGNVGIGTAGPLHRLTVYQDGGSLLNEGGTHSMSILSNQGTAGTNQMLMMLDADYTNQCCSIQSIVNALKVWNLCLNPRGGNVGIGTTNPASLLSVALDGNGSYNPGSWSGSYALFGPGAGSTTGSAVALTWNTTGNYGALVCITAGVLWRDMYYSANQHIFFAPGSAERMRITGTGYVGIGTADPKTPLHVETRTSSTSVTVVSFISSGSPSIVVSGGGTSTYNISIFAKGTIASNEVMLSGGTYNFSDQRIKRNIRKVDSILDTIHQIDIVSYDHIDLQKSSVQYGVVAQQIKPFLSSAVSAGKNWVPAPYAISKSHSLQEGLVTLMVDASSPELQVGRRIRLYIEYDKKETEYETELISLTSTSITCKVWDTYHNDDVVVVYGVEVDDFLSVDKQQLGLLALAGVQELHKTISVHESTIASLQSQNTALQARMDALEALLTKSS